MLVTLDECRSTRSWLRPDCDAPGRPKPQRNRSHLLTVKDFVPIRALGEFVRLTVAGPARLHALAGGGLRADAQAREELRARRATVATEN